MVGCSPTPRSFSFWFFFRRAAVGVAGETGYFHLPTYAPLADSSFTMAAPIPWQLPDTMAVFPLKLDGTIETVGA